MLNIKIWLSGVEDEVLSGRTRAWAVLPVSLFREDFGMRIREAAGIYHSRSITVYANVVNPSIDAHSPLLIRTSVDYRDNAYQIPI